MRNIYFLSSFPRPHFQVRIIIRHLLCLKVETVSGFFFLLTSNLELSTCNWPSSHPYSGPVCLILNPHFVPLEARRDETQVTFGALLRQDTCKGRLGHGGDRGHGLRLAPVGQGCVAGQGQQGSAEAGAKLPGRR